LIDREDRRSQLRTFKEGIAWLKKGVPLMAFPEGKRSKDGRLMEFKGGLFSMAVKTQVPIVPITICNAHAIMPSYGLLPVQRGAGKLHVHVHEAIETNGKTEAELGELVRAAFLSQLPLDQHPLATIEKAVVDNAVASPPPPPKIDDVADIAASAASSSSSLTP
jgi:1-acyl-sn-glycerol-3-phosphate acyltransferase